MPFKFVFFFGRRTESDVGLGQDDKLTGRLGPNGFSSRSSDPCMRCSCGSIFFRRIAREGCGKFSILETPRWRLQWLGVQVSFEAAAFLSASCRTRETRVPTCETILWEYDRRKSGASAVSYFLKRGLSLFSSARTLSQNSTRMTTRIDFQGTLNECPFDSPLTNMLP